MTDRELIHALRGAEIRQKSGEMQIQRQLLYLSAEGLHRERS